MLIKKELNDNLKAKFNPDGSNLRKYQLFLLDILIKFDEICKQNSIEYWLSSGTLLGAVRHGEFIPWDDDIDVELLDEDYEKLKIIFQENHFDDFVFQTHDTDPGYIAPYGKFKTLKLNITEHANADVNYKYKGAYLDVFRMGRRSLICSKLSTKIINNLYDLSHTIVEESQKKEHLKKIDRRYNFIYKKVFPIFKFIDKIFTSKDTLRHDYGSRFYHLRRKSDIFPLKEISFEGKMFPCPNNCDAYLRKIYKNYEEIPQINDIKIHLSVPDMQNL